MAGLCVRLKIYLRLSEIGFLDAIRAASRPLLLGLTLLHPALMPRPRVKPEDRDEVGWGTRSTPASSLVGQDLLYLQTIQRRLDASARIVVQRQDRQWRGKSAKAQKLGNHKHHPEAAKLLE